MIERRHRCTRKETCLAVVDQVQLVVLLVPPDEACKEKVVGVWGSQLGTLLHEMSCLLCMKLIPLCPESGRRNDLRLPNSLESPAAETSSPFLSITTS